MRDLPRLFDVTADRACVLRVHVIPGAGREAVSGTHGDALKVRIKAPAREGAANAALVRFLAALFGLPPRDVEVVTGTRSRTKRVRIRVSPEALEARLAELVG